MSTGEVTSRVDELIRELKLDHCRNLASRGPSEIRVTEDGLCAFHGPGPQPHPPGTRPGNPMPHQHPDLPFSLRKRIFLQGSSVIVVTNEPERYSDFADSFIMFYNGNIVFSGDRGEFLEQKSPYLKQYMTASLHGPMRIL